MQTNLDTLGQRLREIRKSEKLSVWQLSFYTDLGINTLTCIERGTTRYPSIFTLVTLADFYKMPLDELIGREVPKRGV